jgi:dynein heavy chain 1
MSVTARQSKIMNENYLNNPDFDYESVKHASQACGPLYQWVTSQIKFSSILRKVHPLRDEMQELEEQGHTLKAQKENQSKKSHTIVQYKTEYAESIREIKSIKAEMSLVTHKVERAEALLQSLEEKQGWEATSNPSILL